MHDRVDRDAAGGSVECRLEYTTDDPFAGIVRPLDHARRMGFDLIALRAWPAADGFAVALTLCGQPGDAVRSLARRITRDCATGTPVGVIHEKNGAD